MSQVVRNPDQTLTVTLTTLEQKVLLRWATDSAKSPAAQFEDLVDAFLRNKANDYRSLDGPIMRDKYDAATPAIRAQVDALLG